MQHLFRSGKKQTYVFRKRIPKELVDAFGAKEVKKSTRSSVLHVAEERAKAFDLELQQELNELRSLGTSTVRRRFHFGARQGANRLTQLQAHSSQEPKLSEFNPNGWDDIAELDAFLEAWRAWQMNKIRGILEAAQSMKSKIIDGELPNDPSVIAKDLAILNDITGRETISPEPTWREAYELYAEELSRNRPQPQKQSQTRIRANGRNARIVAIYLGHGNEDAGWDTPLSKITSDIGNDFYQHYKVTYPKNSPVSWNKVVGLASAVFNKAIRRFDLIRNNPFSNLKTPEAAGGKVRPFTPSELASLVEALDGWKNQHPERHLISFLMLETGCRTEEAWGLELGDLRLTAEIPHLWFRNNDTRVLGKGSHSRPAVILEPLLSDMKVWARGLEDHTAKSKLFPHTVSRSRPTDSVSQAQMSLIRRRVSTDRRVVMYSSRHTNITRADRAGIRTGLSSYIFGHQNSETTAIHQRYIAGESLAEIRLAMLKIREIEDWIDEWTSEDAF